MPESNKPQKQLHYIPCPKCGEKTDVGIFENTVLVHFPLYCPKCKQETLIDVCNLKMVESK